MIQKFKNKYIKYYNYVKNKKFKYLILKIKKILLNKKRKLNKEILKY